jgi:DNA-binding NtrC family response regulator
MHDSTVPERPARASSAPSPESLIGFVVVWSSSDVEQLGGWLPVREGTWIFGRGAALADDAHPRLQILRQRPGVNLGVSPFRNASLSRVQLLCSRAGSEPALDLDNVGRCSLSVNGREVKRARVRADDVVELGSQLMLLCVRRPVSLPGDPGKHHAFGDADAHGFVGESAAAWKVRSDVAFAAGRALHVLVRGESGTGKELVARALHDRSERKGAFVPRNAATLPEALVDAELFGNAENYPNPGMRERKGLVGAADRGTLFLDEVAELPEAMQTHLLRVLDAGEYQRLGESVARRSDLRVVAATNRPLSALREDVAARFSFIIRVPSLEERREDVPLLARQLLRMIGAEDAAMAERFLGTGKEPRLSQSLIRELVGRPPAGNVRGLRTLLWRALAESPGDVVEVPSEPSPPSSGRAIGSGSERARLQAALEASGGSLEKTWRALGLPSRFALMRLMKKHAVEVKRRVTE